ncbi:MAG: alpha-amylase family glycosyl hydrolase, partial [Bacteroidota bacterium]
MKSSLKSILLCLLAMGTITCAGQEQDPAIYNDDPMQERALNVPESEYYLRVPTGLEEVSMRVEPPNWWVDMKNNRLELMVYAKGAAGYDQVIINYPGVAVESVKRQENPNYLFIGLKINPGTSPGSFQLHLASSDLAQKVMEPMILDYELLPHPRSGWAGREQLGPQDLIYLIMPDRFANGNPDNDIVAETNDRLLNRKKFFFRHGGDLQGIIDHLDYLEDLGVTALWLNPVLENDQPYASYHGYAVTDHYRIDRRFGTNEQYLELVEKAHQKGIKIIMDVIFNHVGDEHYLMKDLPGTDWIHQWPTYTKTTYRAPTLLDPNASEYDRKLMTDGWFDKHMPDLNQ